MHMQEDWISFFGAPIAGVMIADYWIVGKGRPVIALFIPFGVFNCNGVVVAFVVYLISVS